MNDPTRKMNECIAKMTLRNNYWGYLFSILRKQPAVGFGSIMGVAANKDGTLSLLYDPILVDGTDEATIAWILEHEGMHVLNKHITRLLRILANEINEDRKKEKIEIWNIASDCAANEVINFPKKIHICGMEIKGHFPEDHDLPPKHSSEFYFEALQRQQKQKQNQPKHGKGNKSSKGKGGQPAPGMSDHKNWGSAASNVPDLSSLSRKIDGYVNRTVKQSLKNLGKNRGKLSGHIKDLIDALLGPPAVPYYEIIRRMVRGSRMSKFKRAYSRINRKRTYVFNIEGQPKNMPAISPFPGRTRDFTFNVVILIDTSGSMSPDDIKEALAGCKNIIEKDRHCKITVLEVDTQIHKEYVVKRVSDIDFEVKGRGGTTLQAGIERAKELKPDVCLAFTDGYCEDVNKLPKSIFPKKVIWCIRKENGTERNVNETGYVVRM